MESLDATLPYLVRYSYLGVFGLILVFSFVLPFSKTLVIVGAGILAAQGIGSLPAYLLASLAGLMTADSIYYFLGYWGGEKVLEWRLFSGPDREKRFRAAEARFHRHEWLAVFTARFLPFLRSLVFVVAGLSRMSPLRFLLADFLSACILVPVAIASGYFFAENREALVQYVKEGEYVLGVVVFLVLAVLFLFPRRGGGDRTPK
jgi:membrane protein DedA with SNARE-associated domain